MYELLYILWIFHLFGYYQIFIIIFETNNIKKLPGHIVIKNKIKYITQGIKGYSIDSWIFKTPININKMNLDFQLGKPECDGRMNFQLSKIRKVYNPCVDII